MQKVVLFYEHERDDEVEYREAFLGEMKTLLSYFVRVFKAESMFTKLYSKDYKFCLYLSILY